MTGVRHTMATRRRAVRLHEAGWSSHKIRQILQQEGVDPAPCAETILTWCDPEMAERRRERSRTAKRMARRRAGTPYLGAGRMAPDSVRALIEDLHGAGLGCRNVASALSVLFGREVTEDAVRSALEHGSTPRALRRAA